MGRPAIYLGFLRLILAVNWLVLRLSAPANALDPTRQISQYAHTVWRIQDGDFGSAPHAITQTADGYLWIGTDAGLVRFDGVRFVRWTAPPGDHLLDSTIISLLGARDGSLWAGTRTGLDKIQANGLVHYSNARGRVNKIVEDRDGAIWIVRSRVRDGKGPLCQPTGNMLRCYGQEDGVTFPVATALVEDKLGSLWIGSSRGIFRWKAGQTENFIPNQLRQNENMSGVESLVAEADGSLTVGIGRSGKGLGLQRFRDGAWSDYAATGINSHEQEVPVLLMDQNNVLWVGTWRHGLFRIRDGKADHFGTENGLSSNSVENLFQDREGNLWVTTSKGIDRFRDVRVASFSITEGLTSDNVGAVLASRDNTVWVGNTEALDFFRQGKISTIAAGHGLPGRKVTSLLEDHSGRLWVGVDNRLTVFERGQFYSIESQTGDSLGAIPTMTEDIDSDIWAEALGPPLRLLRIRGRKVREEIPVSQVPRAMSMGADPKGGIWLGLTTGDLARYREGRVETFSLVPGGDASGVMNLLVDSDGTVWAATARGLARWKDGKVKILSSQNGLPCDRIIAIIRDNLNSLWLSTECGLVVIAESELEQWRDQPEYSVKVRIFDVFDGAQPGTSSFRPTASKSPDGKLWFATESILQMVDPGHLEVNAVPPPVHIEKIVADGKTYSLRENLRLPPRTRDLEIDYTALSLSIPQKIRFRYKLEGRDAEWEDPQGRRQAFYSDLRPGNYRFHVIACNNDGVWNETGASMGFTLLPAFYQTNWFVLACVASLGCMAWAAYRWRIRLVAARLDSQFQERLAERTRIAQELHDTLLQGFLSASMQLHVANDQLPEDWPAKPIVNRVLDLMRQVIDDGRNAVRGLRSSSTGSDDLEQALSRIPQEFSAQQPVDFRLIVEGKARPLHPIIRDEVYRIGREALANAYHHSRATGIELELEYAESQLRLLVRDNGCGIDPEVLRSGRDGHWGLPGMRERAQRIGANLKVWSRDAGGTEVELLVPGHVAFRFHSPGPGLRWLARLRLRKNKRRGVHQKS